jgi:DNA-binding response OmpR family regulator
MTTKLSLLYAEDDKESRENYGFVLKEYFSEVYLASNGEEALDLYHTHKPDILLLDISMPVLNGLDLVKIIRKKNPDIPIVMLTAHDDRDKLLQAVGLKLDGYLLKPIELSHLKETLLALIKRLTQETYITLRKDLIWNQYDLLYQGRVLKLTKKERLLMQLLCEHPGEYIAHDQLIYHIWNDELPDHSHNKKLVQLIYRLNKKISETLSSEDIYLIENSYTHGYRVNCY